MQTCPNCDREIESGFRFCDNCGTKLDAGHAAQAQGAGSTPAPEARPDAMPESKPESKPESERDDTSRSPFFVDRLRARRQQRARERYGTPPEPAPTLPPPPPPQRPGPPSPPPPPPAAPPPRPQPSSPPESSRTFGIAGKLRWSDEDAETKEGRTPSPAEERPAPAPVPPAPAPTWRPAPSEREPESTSSTIARLLLHLVVAFVSGALVVGLAAVIASLATSGRVAMLEVRGLPIFIAGAISIVVFAVLQTASGARKASVVRILAGFLVLVAAVAFAFQPSVMASAQERLDEVLGVVGEADEAAVEAYRSDVTAWTAEVRTYRSDVLLTFNQASRSATEPEQLASAEERFRTDAAASDQALTDILERMRGRVGTAEYEPLAEGLSDLTAIYDEQLEAIGLITRGFIERSQELIAAGDARFKESTERAVTFVDDTLADVLERGDIDVAGFRATVADLATP